MCRRVQMQVIKFVAQVNMKLLMAQILVVVANIQTLLLKTRVGGVPCEQ